MFRSFHAYAASRFAAALIGVMTTAALAAPDAARSADAFVDSIGVNTHYGNAIYVGGNAYANPLIDQKLAELGVRHLRDHTWNDTGLARVDALHAAHGIRTNLILGETTRTPADLVNLMKNHVAYEAIEGLNEPDFAPRTYGGFTDVPANNDYSATRAFQNDLYAAMNADAATKDTPVLSPAMGRSVRSQYLIPIGFDVAAMHNYGWAAGTPSHMPSAGLDTAIADMAALRGTKPLWATETGYFNRGTDARRVPEAVSAKYIPRGFAEFFNRGVERTYLYELADQGPSATAREENFGLVRYDMSEKPAFVAVENLIDLLEEPEVAGDFAPAALNYTLTSSASLANVHHTLLQKSDGRFYLMLWQEVANFDRPTQTEIVAAPIAVTLALHDPIAQARTYLTNRSLTPTATFVDPTSLNLNVLDEMLVVELTPVPEPSGVALVFLVGAACVRRPRA